MELTGNVADSLPDDLYALWNGSIPENVDFEETTYTWEELIESVQLTARIAAEEEKTSPTEIIDGMIHAVTLGLVDGNYYDSEDVLSETFPIKGTPRTLVCGCLIGQAANFSDMNVAMWDKASLIQRVRSNSDSYAPVEVLAFLLRKGDTDKTPQGKLMIDVLQKAKATL